MAILLMVIGGYSINGYLVIIILMAINSFSIGGYWL
jgi:hypothetical protein